MNNDFLLSIANEFTNKMPFCKFLDFTVVTCDENITSLSFPMKEKFVGNHHLQVLHGGVISAILDTAGAIMAVAGVYKKSPELFKDPSLSWFKRSGTLDIRIDYLQPGKGQQFRADARLLRSGNRVSVTRMELHNENENLIAVGTGTYLISDAT